jgi:hypothetical protein
MMPLSIHLGDDMKTSQFFISSLVLLLGLNQTACSVKASSDAPSDETVAGASTGLNLKEADGTWSTGCYIDKWGFASYSTLHLDNAQYALIEKFYKYGACTETELDWTTKSEGTAVVVGESSTESGSWEVEMRVPFTGGYSIHPDLIRREESDKLFLGDIMAAKNGIYPSKVERERLFRRL